MDCHGLAGGATTGGGHANDVPGLPGGSTSTKSCAAVECEPGTQCFDTMNGTGKRQYNLVVRAFQNSASVFPSQPHHPRLSGASAQPPPAEPTADTSQSLSRRHVTLHRRILNLPICLDHYVSRVHVACRCVLHRCAPCKAGMGHLGTQTTAQTRYATRLATTSN